METMTRKDEQELLAAVREVAWHVSQGDAPTDAVVKVAEDRSLTREHALRVAEAFNVSATLTQYKEASGASRADDFPLADPEAVLAKLYPESVDSPVKAAAATWTPGPEAYVETRDFMLGDIPTFSSKTASSGMDPAVAFDTIACDYRKEAAAFDRLKSGLGQCAEQLTEAVDKLASYFTALGTGDVSELPDDARELVVERIPGLRKEGYASIGAWKPALAALYARRSDYVKQAQLAADAEAGLEQLADMVVRRVQAVKRAEGGMLGAGAAGAVFNEMLAPADKAKAMNKVDVEMSDPEFMGERKAMQAQVMLKDLVEGDEVLRHAPQEEVVRAFNEIAQLAPTVATQPMLTRAYLRRIVESKGMDPFDIHQLVKTERDMRAPAPSGDAGDDVVTA